MLLKGIPVGEFMGTMGVFSAALGISCEDCHGSGDTAWEQYALDTSPRKVTARRMIQMMSSINQASFGGRQVVTCYTCHRGSDRPKVTPSLARLYGDTSSEEVDDIVRPASGAPSAEAVLDKYIQAIGGAGRLATLSSFVAKGMSAGYGPESTPRPIEIFAKAPGQRTTIIHTLDGDNTTTYDGRSGWIAAPHRPLPVLPLVVSRQTLVALTLIASQAIVALECASSPRLISTRSDPFHIQSDFQLARRSSCTTTMRCSPRNDFQTGQSSTLRCSEMNPPSTPAISALP